MSRTVYLLGWALLLVAGAFLLTDALLWRPGVSAANVRRIRLGMTTGEVEGLLGGPAPIHFMFGYQPGAGRAPPPSPSWAIWEGRSGRVIVTFDSAERVTEVAFTPSPAPPTLSPLVWPMRP